MNHHTLTTRKRALAAALAVLQIIPAGLLPSLAQAQQTNVTTYGYDAQGNLTQIADPNSKLTTQTPDSLDRITSQTLPPPTASASSPVVSYTYDGLNRLLSVTDGRGAKTTYIRGGFNDVLKTHRDFGSLTSIHNENGDEYYSTNTRSQSRWVSGYDQLNRPTIIDYVDENGGGVTGNTRLGYDATLTSGVQNFGVGHLTSVIDYTGITNNIANATNSVSFRYDQLGRITWRCQFWAGLSAGSATACDNSDALSYRWAQPTDPNYAANVGRLMGLTYPSGRKVDYQYDSLGRINAITTTDPSGSNTRSVISSVNYAALALSASGYAAKSWQFGDGVTPPVQSYTRSYDTWARASGFTLGAGAVGLTTAQSTYILTLDDAGRVKEIDNTTAQATLQSNLYGYDDLNRLTTASLPGGVNYSYNYDLNGNRILSTSGSVSTVYAYPSSGSSISNRLSTVQVAAAASQPISTDTTGNITQDPAAVVGAVSYTYDDRANVPYGRLSRSQGPGAQWDYKHNFFGQRIRKTGSTYTPTGGSAISPASYVGSTDTQYYYDMAGHLIAEVDASVGASVAPKPVKREYIWLGDTLVAVIAGGVPTAVVNDSSNSAAIYYVHTDHLDTPRLVTDTAGTLRWSLDIMATEPFGASAPNESPVGQTFVQSFTLNLRFPGQYLDKETGSFYNYFRTYNPSTGRYLQSDPIGLQGGLNTYNYVDGNPLTYIDPYGLSAMGDVGGIIGTWGGRVVGGAAGEIIDPAGGGIPGALIGGKLGKAAGTATGDWLDNLIFSKGGKQNVRDTGLIGVSDEEIGRRLKDPSTSADERKRLVKEQKARGNRNTDKDRKNCK